MGAPAQGAKETKAPQPQPPTAQTQRARRLRCEAQRHEHRAHARRSAQPATFGAENLGEEARRERDYGFRRCGEAGAPRARLERARAKLHSRRPEPRAGWRSRGRGRGRRSDWRRTVQAPTRSHDGRAAGSGSRHHVGPAARSLLLTRQPHAVNLVDETFDGLQVLETPRRREPFCNFFELLANLFLVSLALLVALGFW